MDQYDRALRAARHDARSRTFGVPTLPPVRRTLLAPRRFPIQNRVRVLLIHIPFFSIRGQARLAHEAAVTRSTISRLVNGGISPSYRLARTVTDALERRLGRPLDIREVFSTDGTYPTPSGCALCGCRGCLPEAAWNEDGILSHEWQATRPGDWSLARPADPPPSALVTPSAPVRDEVAKEAKEIKEAK